MTMKKLHFTLSTFILLLLCLSSFFSFAQESVLESKKEEPCKSFNLNDSSTVEALTFFYDESTKPPKLKTNGIDTLNVLVKDNDLNKLQKMIDWSEKQGYSTKLNKEDTYRLYVGTFKEKFLLDDVFNFIDIVQRANIDLNVYACIETVVFNAEK